MRHYNYNRGCDNRHGNNNPAGRFVFGIIVALIGVGLLLKALDIFPFYFRLSWPVILIAIGMLIGIKNGFRNNAWWILVVIGVAHLIPSFQILGKSSRVLIWPFMVILAGVMIAFRPRRHRTAPDTVGGAIVNATDRLVVDVTFGGRKEIVTSRDFKGGTVNVTFGGSEINLTQTDFSAPSIELDCRVVFGAIELVIPANWDIQNEIRPSFGSVEDQRVVVAGPQGETRKKLILTGTCSMGSIEIKSY